MLDITKMLHQVIDLELDIDNEKELMIGPEVRKQLIFVDLDLTLSNTAEAADGIRYLILLKSIKISF